MPDLDFTALKQISYQGFKTEQEKDSLLEQGFTIVQGEKTPFETPEPPPSPDPPRGSATPQLMTDKQIFRAAFDFLAQHQPTERTAEYWQRVATDSARIWNQGNNSPFLQDMLIAVMDELERRQPPREWEE